MGTVLTNCTCAKCKSNGAVDDYNYKTGEYNIFCKDCGYSDIVFILRDKNRKMLPKDPNKELLYSNLVYLRRRKFPYGTIIIGGSRFVSFFSGKKRKIKRVIKNNDFSKSVFVIYKRWDGKQHLTEILKGSTEDIPKDLLAITEEEYDVLVDSETSGNSLTTNPVNDDLPF